MADQETTPILTAPRAVAFTRTGANPPGEAYITSEDSLRVAIIAVVAMAVNVSARVLRFDGQIIPLVFVVQCTTANTMQFSTIPLCEGFLLDCSITPVATPLTRGMCYVTASITRGPAAAPIVMRQLVGDYLTGACALSWPNAGIESPQEGTGYLRAIQIANPAPGTEWSAQPAANTRWRVMSMFASLACSAQVATRQLDVLLWDTLLATYIYGCASLSSQTASTTGYYCLVPGCVPAAFNPQTSQVPLPGDTRLTAAQQVKTSTVGLQTGDQWQQIYLYVEQLFDL